MKQFLYDFFISLWSLQLSHDSRQHLYEVYFAESLHYFYHQSVTRKCTTIAMICCRYRELVIPFNDLNSGSRARSSDHRQYRETTDCASYRTSTARLRTSRLESLVAWHKRKTWACADVVVFHKPVDTNERYTGSRAILFVITTCYLFMCAFSWATWCCRVIRARGMTILERKLKWLLFQNTREFPKNKQK